MTDLTALRFEPLTLARWADLEDRFGPRGASGGCWCMLWRLRRADWEAGRTAPDGDPAGAPNRAALRGRVTEEDRAPPGMLAYDGALAIGWCSIAPRTEFPSLANSRVLAPVDGAAVWSVSCFYLRAGRRRQGVSVPLLEAAVRLAAAHGAEIIEGYPIDPTRSKARGAYGSGFAWTGFSRTFEAAGFQEAARRSDTRPIMRRSV